MIDIDIHDIALSGEGVARLPSGETVFIAGAIAGERVRASLGGGRPRRGRLLAVIAPSPERVEPPCPHAARCGGCDFMHLTDAARSRWQQLRILRALEPALGHERVEPVLHHPSPALGYRSRARVHIESNGARARVGYRGARSHQLIDIDACAVLGPDLAPALGELRELLAPSRGSGEAQIALGVHRAGAPQSPAPGATTGEPGGSLRRARVYELDWSGELAPDSLRRLDAAIDAGAIAGARIWLDRAREPMVAGDPRPVAAGADGLPLILPPGGFAQGSDGAAVALGNRVAELAQRAPGDRRAIGKLSAVELFAGSGTLTVALGRVVGSLLAVERDDAAVAALRDNIRRRGLDAPRDGGGGAAVRVRQGDANAMRLPRSELVVLDPPRAGAAGASQRIAEARPARVIYVSCNAATLARDLRVLLGAGYRLQALELFDLFPQTSHVEVVALLCR